MPACAEFSARSVDSGSARDLCNCMYYRSEHSEAAQLSVPKPPPKADLSRLVKTGVGADESSVRSFEVSMHRLSPLQQQRLWLVSVFRTLMLGTTEQGSVLWLLNNHSLLNLILVPVVESWEAEAKAIYHRRYFHDQVKQDALTEWQIVLLVCFAQCSEMPEEHMKFSHLAIKPTCVQRLKEFLSGPLQRELEVSWCVPGLGQGSVSKLNDMEIFTLVQLMGKFMSFDRDCALMIMWLERGGAHVEHLVHGCDTEGVEEENICSARYAETVVYALAMKLHILLDFDVAEQSAYNSSEHNLDDHMKFSHLAIRSTQRLPEFSCGPLPRELEVVPGLGQAHVSKLNDMEIFTLDQLMGKFMSLDRDCALMMWWLEEHRLIRGQWIETVVYALAMKLHILLDKSSQS